MDSTFFSAHGANAMISFSKPSPPSKQRNARPYQQPETPKQSPKKKATSPQPREEQIDKVEEGCKSHVKTISQLTARLTSIESNLAESVANAKALSETLTQKQTQILSLKQTHINSQKELKEYTGILESTTNELECIKVKYEKLNDKYDQLSSTVEKDRGLRNQIDKLKGIVQGLSRDLDLAQCERDLLVQELCQRREIDQSAVVDSGLDLLVASIDKATFTENYLEKKDSSTQTLVEHHTELLTLKHLEAVKQIESFSETSLIKRNEKSESSYSELILEPTRYRFKWSFLLFGIVTSGVAWDILNAVLDVFVWDREFEDFVVPT